MFQLRTVLVLALATSTFACDAADAPSIDEAEQGLELTLELPSAPASARFEPAPSPDAQVDGAIDIRSRIEDPAVTHRAPDLRPEMANVELRARAGRVELAPLVAQDRPGAPIEVGALPEIDHGVPPRVVFTPVDDDAAAVPVCEASCAVAGATASGAMIGLDDDALCVCYAPRLAALDVGCVPVAVQVNWAKGGLIQMNEATHALRCR